MALAGDRVLRLGRRPHDLDEMIGPGTICLDLPDHCILPGFTDAHVHQLEATQDLGSVDVGSAVDITGMLDLLRTAAASAPAGSWIVTHRGWHESHLAERRMPTSAELDGVTTTHPVMVRRGSHRAVLNSEGIRRAHGVDDVDEHGRHTGRVHGLGTIRAILDREAFDPTHTPGALAGVCAIHAARGIVGVRDAGIGVDEVSIYEDLAERGGLAVRTDVMIAVPRELDHDEKLAFVSDLSPPQGRRGQYLSVTGVKLFADGHISDAALRPESARRQVASGELIMSAAEIAEVAERAAAMGWRVGCHVVGDRALDAALDAYERVHRSHRSVPAGHLAVEHALVADEAQRLRTAQLGVGVTVQHPLLDLYGAQMVEEWGDELAARASPVRSWLASGALVAAGSDGHVAPFDPVRSISGLVTRRTKSVGVLGADEGISLDSAIRLYTVASHWLTEWTDAPPGLVDGGLADFVVFDRCLLEADPEHLGEETTPIMTVCGGRPTHDPTAMWPERADTIG
jgi:predicted amidohydrolase YtcJ